MRPKLSAQAGFHRANEHTSTQAKRRTRDSKPLLSHSRVGRGSLNPKRLNPKGSLSAKACKGGGKFEPATCPGGDFDVISLTCLVRLVLVVSVLLLVLRSYSLVWICPTTRVLSESSRAIIRAELLNPKP